MANIVITTTADQIEIVSNDLAIPSGSSKAVHRRENLESISMSPDESAVYVRLRSFGEAPVSHDGSNGTLQIDTIDGAAPTSMNDLYDKLKALIP